MDSERVIDALRRLEQVNPNLSGYTAKEVLFAMGEKINRATEKAVRTFLKNSIPNLQAQVMTISSIAPTGNKAVCTDYQFIVQNKVFPSPLSQKCDSGFFSIIYA